MTRKAHKAVVVVDTSVARAAGHARPDAGTPSPACVDALMAIQQADLRVAMSPALKAEWDEHAQSFATKWLYNRIARKRFLVHRDEWDELDRLLACAAQLPARKRREAEKDAHLVGLAMSTGERVLSLDAAQLELLRELHGCHATLGRLHWAIATDPAVAAWLRSGSQATLSFQVAGVARR